MSKARVHWRWAISHQPADPIPTEPVTVSGWLADDQGNVTIDILRAVSGRPDLAFPLEDDEVLARAESLMSKWFHPSAGGLRATGGYGPGQLADAKILLRIAADRARLQRAQPVWRPEVLHTGMAAHDGYVAHSHEVRQDHDGVARQEDT